MKIFKKKKLTNLYTISLEELSARPQSVSKNLYKFLGFKWSKECIENHDSNITFNTLSNIQVQKKIKKHDLSDISKYAELIRKLGYDYSWLA